MKNEFAKKAFKNKGIFLLWFLATLVPAFSQPEQSRTLTGAFAGKTVAAITHQRGPLIILPSRDGKISYEAVISMKSGDPENTRIIFDNFLVGASEKGDELILETETGIKNWQSVNGKTTITLKNGNKVKDIKDIKVEMRVYVPRMERLKLKNKYEDILIQTDLECHLDVELYSAGIEAGNISGDLTLDLKYSKGKIGNFRNGALNIYDCNLDFGNAENIELTSKYSKLTLGDIAAASCDTYDDEIVFGRLSAPLTLTDKYSILKFTSFSQARMDLYDTDLVAGEGKNLQVKSKYSSISMESLENLEFELSYDDEIKVGALNRLSANSKYSDFDIRSLNDGFNLISYDDEVRIGNISGQLKKIALEGKYTTMTLTLPADLEYRLEANTTYGRLSYPEKNLEPQIHKQLNDKLELRGRTRGANEESPLILINAYDCKIDIK